MRVTYNDVDLAMCHTNIERSPMMSDDGTEILWMRTVLDVSAVYNPGVTSYEVGNPPAKTIGSSPARTDEAIRYALMEPRKKLFLYADEGVGYLTHEVPAPGLDRDPSNGPRPISCRVKSITPSTWQVSWRVEFHTIECEPDDPAAPPIISNRWSQSQATGPDHRTTITTRGVTTFRADLLEQSGRLADYYRSAVIPGNAPPFRRMSVDVTVNSTGNILVWQVVDQEQFVSIGATDDPRRMGVVDFEAVFSTSSNPLDTSNQPSNWIIGQFDGYARGNAKSSKQGMLNWLAGLAVERCAIPAGPVDPMNQAMILKVTTSEKLHAPEVELHVTVQIPPAKPGKVGLGELRAEFIGVDRINAFSNDGNSPQMPSDGNTRGTARALALVAALREACSAPADLPTRSEGSPQSPGENSLSGWYDPEVNVSIGDLEDTYTRFSDDATTNGTYTDMKVEMKTFTNMGRLAAPIAGKVRPADSDLDSDPDDDSDDSDEGRVDVEILSVSRPISKVEVSFEVERVSSMPLIPDPNSADPNMVLMSEKIWRSGVGIAPDGQTPIYKLGGVYEYTLKKSRKPGSAFNFPVHPWTDFYFGETSTMFPESNFSGGIIDDGGDGGSLHDGDPGPMPGHDN